MCGGFKLKSYDILHNTAVKTGLLVLLVACRLFVQKCWK